MIAGCGIDIEEISRFRGRIPENDKIPSFSELVYSDDEIAINRKSFSEIKFPLCFSCKEAFFKALGATWTTSPVTWKEIELLFHDETDISKYEIRLSGYARELYDSKLCKSFETGFEYNNEFVEFQVILLK
jgi:phosphopantetheine--protein transferase-like protein